MKKSKAILFPLLAVFTIATTVSCNNNNNDSVTETQNTQYTITTRNSDLFAGSITELSGVKYDAGTSVRLVASPSFGYSFLGWYDGDTLITSEAEYSLKLESNLELTAKWKKEFQTYSLNTLNMDSDAGDITSHVDSRFKENTNVTLEANAKEGYKFEGWYEGETLLSQDTTYTFTIDHNIVIQAKWKSISAFIINTTNDNPEFGDITSYTNQKYYEGDTVELSAKAKDGYVFVGWYIGDDLFTHSTSYSFKIYSDLVLTAKWAKTYEFSTVNEDTSCGTITSFTNEIFKENDEITVEATPATGYVFAGWYSEDTVVSTSPTFKFNIHSDLTLTAKWATSCLLTTISDNNNGYVTPYNNENFELGSSVTLEASGYAGYLFDGWYSGDTVVSTSSTYTFTIDSNVELTAKWKINPNIAYKLEDYTYEGNSVPYITGINDHSVQEIVIPNGVDGILDDVFDFDNNITSVTFPKTLTWVGGNIFTKNGEIDFYYDGDWFDFNKIYRSNAQGMPFYHSGGNIYFLDENGTHLHNGKRYSLQIDIILPEGINKLQANCFAGFNHVESLYMPASVTEFNGGWQFNKTSFKKIYYGGTQEAWNSINKDENDSNRELKNMTIYFYSEDAPATSGNYWHYVDGIITIWE